MNYPQEFLDALIASEGLKDLPYVDSTGNETIGVGHNLTKRLTRGAIDHILNDDLLDSINEVNEALPWTVNLDRVRYWSLVELAFNMGIGRAAQGSYRGSGLLSFTNMLDAVQKGQYANAASALLNSKWAEQVGDRRANRIANQLKTGNWQ